MKKAWVLIPMLMILIAGLAIKKANGSLFKTAASRNVLTASPFDQAHRNKLSQKGQAALAFAKSHAFNTSYCFLIDMSLPSGQDRFFVYLMNTDSIRAAGLVTHGRCNEEWLEGRKYGNTVGCGCTSLGKYRIGNSYTGRFGKAFKLYGLEKTNDKAFDRYVVLHAHECVPSRETKEEICQSDGCPTVAPDFLKRLDPLIRQSDRPVLLWIFE
ncbi:MAG TPA: murein L,D-transpeptidase catalytic domain family protein [Flavisolibacter sp.]|jgi:hypothetical protein|nr:murein L,D-transpeptidase catalytic domain family protein [Flavisolibacter sp.]